eukprot:CAMPEP_0179241646 /NCGR_PEP_ID=MMETSP0797-20121207/16602_1 /TAXON_ID=47934 /ORGANISM="Dinophysis acuminata, Strain DAEP01" /LENGTH=69 /DNA_ID=CAMNT_0020949043 /DNA_START=65 /DNA_END=271 /DNA_ORIENTATION=+
MWARVCGRFAPVASAGAAASSLFPQRTSSKCDNRSGSVFPAYDSDGGFTHDTDGGFSLFLQERCQRIFF